MASVALFVAVDTFFGGTTAYANALRYSIIACGHTCDIYQSATSGQTPASLAPILTPYDIVFVLGLSFSAISDTSTYAYMLHTLYKQGKPMIVADTASTSGSDPSVMYSGGTLSARMGMYAHTIAASASDSDYVIDLRTSTDPILDGRQGLTVVSSASVAQTAFRIDSIAPQAEIIGWANPANASFGNMWGMILKCPKGAMSLLGTPFPANAAHIGFAFGGTVGNDTAYMANGSAAGVKILGNLIDWLMSNYRLAGTIQDSGGAPLTRGLKVYASSGGRLIGKTTSATDGTFQLRTPTNETMYIVVDNTAGTGPSGTVITNVTPVAYTPVFSAPPAKVIHHGSGRAVNSTSVTLITAASSNATNVGDLLVAIVHRTSAPAATLPSPAGWTLVGSTAPAAGTNVPTQYVDIYTKTAVQADIAANFQFRQLTSGNMSVQILSMFGTTGTPIAGALTSDVLNNTTNQLVTFPSVTVPANTASIAVMAYSLSSASQISYKYIRGRWDNQGLVSNYSTWLAVGVTHSPTDETLVTTGQTNTPIGANTAGVNMVILTLSAPV